jgi:CspA family cold shock protein
MRGRIPAPECVLGCSLIVSVLERMIVARGTVKWFNPTKGYGFIQPDGGGKDVFLHISAVEQAGLSTLNEGAKVEYEVVADRGKESAGKLKVM